MIDDAVAAGCLAVLWAAIEPVLTALYAFCRWTGDFIIDLLTFDLFQGTATDPQQEEKEHPVPGWLSAVLGLGFWMASAGAVYASWPWLASL